MPVSTVFLSGVGGGGGGGTALYPKGMVFSLFGLK